MFKDNNNKEYTCRYMDKNKRTFMVHDIKLPVSNANNLLLERMNVTCYLLQGSDSVCFTYVYVCAPAAHVRPCTVLRP